MTEVLSSSTSKTQMEKLVDYINEVDDEEAMKAGRSRCNSTNSSVTAPRDDSRETAEAEESKCCDSAAVVECLVCFDEFDAGDDGERKVWKCPSGCTVCLECVETFLRFHTTEKTLHHLVCPGYCQEVRTADDFQGCGIDKELMREFTIAYQLACNPDATLCPSCERLTDSKPNRPNLTCTHCSTKFCYFHGLEHAGRDCEDTVELSAWHKMRTRMWLAMNTRKCRKCNHRIQKNGGCPHMTCRCGHEICWHCGGDYRRHGRGGHGRQLFPRPSQLKYQCNGWKIWSQRVGIVVVGVPVAGAAVGLAVGLSPLVGLGLAGIIARRKIQRAQRNRRYQRERRARAQAIAAQRNTEACRLYHEEHGTICLTCNDRTVCTRHSIDRETSMCRNCSHYESSVLHQVETSCVHFFGGRTHCLFCNEPMWNVTNVTGHPEIAVRNELIARIHAQKEMIHEQVKKRRPAINGDRKKNKKNRRARNWAREGSNGGNGDDDDDASSSSDSGSDSDWSTGSSDDDDDDDWSSVSSAWSLVQQRTERLKVSTANKASKVKKENACRALELMLIDRIRRPGEAVRYLSFAPPTNPQQSVRCKRDAVPASTKASASTHSRARSASLSSLPSQEAQRLFNLDVQSAAKRERARHLSASSDYLQQLAHEA